MGSEDSFRGAGCAADPTLVGEGVALQEKSLEK